LRPGTTSLAGGGLRGGNDHGETDEFGGEAVIDRHHLRDLHATILQLMEHQNLAYLYGGFER